MKSIIFVLVLLALIVVCSSRHISTTPAQTSVSKTAVKKIPTVIKKNKIKKIAGLIKTKKIKKVQKKPVVVRFNRIDRRIARVTRKMGRFQIRLNFENKALKHYQKCYKEFDNPKVNYITRNKLMKRFKSQEKRVDRIKREMERLAKKKARLNARKQSESKKSKKAKKAKKAAKKSSKKLKVVRKTTKRTVKSSSNKKTILKRE